MSSPLKKYATDTPGESMFAGNRTGRSPDEDLEHARQVTPPDIGIVEEIDQGVIFRRAANHLEWVAFFLMCLDFPVTVLQPEALLETLQKMATKALQMAEIKT